MISKEKTVCFTGHRTEKLENIYLINNKLFKEIEKQIQNGYENFINGACYGFDLMAAVAVDSLKEKYPYIKNYMAIPFKGHCASWEKKDVELFEKMLERSDDYTYIGEKYVSGIYYKRNRMMVNKSSLVIACGGLTGGTGYTIKYANENRVPVINIA